jgi:SAM-dependent methyltransferase
VRFWPKADMQIGGNRDLCVYICALSRRFDWSYAFVTKISRRWTADIKVSQADGDKWDARYREGAYATRKHPSALLAEWLPKLAFRHAHPRAIDVGCGTGRNAIYLARQGWQVDAVDISEVALDLLTETAAAENLPITCIQMDLERAVGRPTELFTANWYDLVLMVRYTNLPLIDTLKGALKAGGYLIVEEHLLTEADVIGPRDPKFCVAPDVLREAAAGLDIIAYREGIVTGPDGRSAALARLVARAPR